MRAGDVCNRDVVIVRGHESINEVVRLMREYHVGDVVVVEEREGRNVPVGMLTDRDIVIEVLAEDVSLRSVAAVDVMSPEIVTVGDDEELAEAIKTMRAKGVRRLPVVDGNGALVGIVTVDDAIALLAELVGDLTGLIRREQDRERAVRTRE